MDVYDSGNSTWFSEGYPEEVSEFLLERGAIEYLSYLSQEPRRFVEIQDALAIGDGTLNELHTRAEGLQLKSTGQQKREGKIYPVHSLTPMGGVVTDRMQELGVTQRHERLRTVRDEYERAKDDYVDWVEGPDGLVTDIQNYLEMLDSD